MYSEETDDKTKNLTERSESMNQPNWRQYLINENALAKTNQIKLPATSSSIISRAVSQDTPSYIFSSPSQVTPSYVVSSPSSSRRKYRF